MSFIGVCSLSRIAGSGSRQMRSGASLVARSQQHKQSVYLSSAIDPKEPAKSSSAASTGSASVTANLSARTHSPNNFEKKLLVFTKKYKSAEEIPSLINQDVMERCRNQVRIKIANYMMIATAIGCIVMIISGKKAQERGDTVQKMNLDWHKQYNEQAKKEDAATKN